VLVDISTAAALYGVAADALETVQRLHCVRVAGSGMLGTEAHTRPDMGGSGGGQAVGGSYLHSSTGKGRLRWVGPGLALWWAA
jgi:hypothetical protein